MTASDPITPATPVSLPAPTRRPTPGQLTFAAPRRGKPPQHLADLDPAERKAAVEALGQKGFRAKQLSTHYFERLVEAPEDMTDLPKAIRDELVAGLLPQLITPVRTLEADEGATIKSVWRLHDGALVESVLMRYPGRVTICVSSQAGCGMNCPFCATGQEGLTRNMSTAEIVEQVVARGPVAAARRARRRPRGLPAAGQQRGLHGHGRGAGQLQGRHRRDPAAHRPGPRRPGHVGPRHHDVHGRPRAGDRQAGRRGPAGDARAVAARPRRRAAQRAGADQHPLVGGRGDRRRPPLLRDDRAAGSASSTP